MPGLFGIGVKFTFDAAKALKQMNLVSKGMIGLNNAVDKVGPSVARAGRILKTGLAVGGLAATAVMAKAISTAANFEQQMSAVSAVSNASAADMQRLTAQAKEMGATTSFSATQAAQGQELLARAGFSTTQIMQALPGVMNAAAAEGMDLATATSIVSDSVKAFGLEAGDATRVADVLALASSKSNTNMVGLGEGIAYSAAQMHGLGYSIENTSAALGVLADAGLKGSMGGTSLTNAFVKMSKPSKEASNMMKKWGISLTDADGKMKSMGTIVDLFKGKLDGIKDTAKRQAMMTELFGIRGQKAMAALMLKGGKSIDAFSETLQNSTGAASKMAQKRLDNLKGAMTLFKSVIEGLFIETGGGFFGL